MPEKPVFKILLIEDDSQFALMMLSIISSMHLSADHAVDTIAAITFAGKQNYDLAMLDIQIGDENGLDLIKTLRKHQPDLDIITMTGDNRKTVESTVRELGVLYHLIKPFSINELTALLRHSVDRSVNTPMFLHNFQ